MTRPLSMTETADAVGLSVERFRKVWPEWVRKAAFPAPMLRPARVKGRERKTWEPAAVDDWKAARTRALGKGRLEPGRAANDEAVPAAIADRVARERSTISDLMRRNA